MGLVDRLDGVKRRLWSPMNVWMVDLGSDKLVHSGGPATVVDVPEGVPPTLHNGGVTSVVWQVRVKRGKSAGWNLVGVLDPEAAAGARNEPSQGLLSFLASLDSPR